MESVDGLSDAAEEVPCDVAGAVDAVLVEVGEVALPAPSIFLSKVRSVMRNRGAESGRRRV